MAGQYVGHTTNLDFFLCPRMWPKMCLNLWSTEVVVGEVMHEFVGRILVFKGAVEGHDFG